MYCKLIVSFKYNVGLIDIDVTSDSYFLPICGSQLSQHPYFGILRSKCSQNTNNDLIPISMYRWQILASKWNLPTQAA